MNAVYYTDKSIAVFGDTKPWQENLRALGGKFNGSLKGGPGWIFQRSKEGELMQFIGAANAGAIQPAPAQTPIYQQVGTYPQVGMQPGQYHAPQQHVAQMVPMNAYQPAMDPSAAMAQLLAHQPARSPSQIAQPVFPQQSTQQSSQIPQQSSQPMITQFSIQPVAKPLPVIPPIVPAPTGEISSAPQTVSFPNRFRAADNLVYQILLYTVPVPTLNQQVTLTVGAETARYVITNVVDQDEIVLSNIDNESNVYTAFVVKGQWRILSIQEAHTLMFHA